MNQNLASNLTSTAQAHGHSPALRLGETVLSYAELDDASARVAGLLRERGLEPGDRVGIMLPNVPQFAVAYYGVLRAGGVVVPMNVLLKEREVAFYLGDPEVKLVFAWHEFAQAAEHGAAQAGSECVLVAPGECRGGSASQARSVPRSRGFRCASSTISAGRWRRARPARSRSAATTS